MERDVLHKDTNVFHVEYGVNSYLREVRSDSIEWFVYSREEGTWIKLIAESGRCMEHHYKDKK